jgi:hypothetical protein
MKDLGPRQNTEKHEKNDAGEPQFMGNDLRGHAQKYGEGDGLKDMFAFHLAP